MPIMSASTQDLRATTVDVAEPGPRKTLAVLRVIAVLHALAAVVQPMLAGIYLSGDVDAIDIHELNASIVMGLGLLQLIAAIVFVWKGRGREWALYASIGILLAEVAQTGFGYAQLVALHLPLGVSIVSMLILLAVWLCRDVARTPRGRKP
jgi:hypothetical protein